MNKSNSSVFKYQFDERTAFTTAQIWILLGLAGLTLAGLFIGRGVPVVAVVLMVGYSIYAWPKKTLCLTPRYLLCGSQVVYYRNVTHMNYRPEYGEFILSWGERNSLRIERERFPTNARKPEKIAKNKAAKFEKVALKIVDKVLAAAPEAVLEGISRPVPAAAR